MAWARIWISTLRGTRSAKTEPGSTTFRHPDPRTLPLPSPMVISLSCPRAHPEYRRTADGGTTGRAGSRGLSQRKRKRRVPRPANCRELHPGIDPTPLSDYEIDHDHYDKGPDQRWEVLHSHILLQQPNKCASYANELTAAGHWCPTYADGCGQASCQSNRRWTPGRRSRRRSRRYEL
jgi:hypothetical protein